MKPIFILIIALSTLSCQTKDKNEGESVPTTKITLDFSPVTQQINISELVDSVEIIALVLPPDEIVGILKKVIFSSQHIFAFCERQKAVFIFNKKGDFLSKIDRRGNGPGEYTSLSNILLVNDKIALVDTQKSEILFFTFDGNFVRSTKSTDIFRDIIHVDSDTLLCYTPDFMRNNKYGLWEMSVDGKDGKQVLLPSKHFSTVNAPWYNLYQTENGHIGVFFSNRNEIYYYKDNNISLAYLFEPNAKTLASFPLVESKLTITDEYYEPVYFLDTNNWLYSCWANTIDFSMRKFLYSKKENKTHRINEFNMDIDLVRGMGYPVFSNETNCLLTVIYPDETPDIVPSNIRPSASSVVLQKFHFR